MREMASIYAIIVTAVALLVILYVSILSGISGGPLVPAALGILLTPWSGLYTLLVYSVVLLPFVLIYVMLRRAASGFS